MQHDGPGPPDVSRCWQPERIIVGRCACGGENRDYAQEMAKESLHTFIIIDCVRNSHMAANGGVRAERFIKPPQFGSKPGLRFRIAPA
jgi:hypothetical protein